MPKKQRRVFERRLKIATAKRMLAGENICAVCRELGIARAIVYRWKDEYQEAGAAAFRRRPGRPPKHGPGVEKARAEAAGELAAAQQRIAVLERKVGQQQVELDFFRRALRQIEAARPSNGEHGAKASTPSSRR